MMTLTPLLPYKIVKHCEFIAPRVRGVNSSEEDEWILQILEHGQLLCISTCFVVFMLKALYALSSYVFLLRRISKLP